VIAQTGDAARHVSRRAFLASCAVGAVAVGTGSALTSCGTGKSTAVTHTQLQKLLPHYSPTSYVKPDLPAQGDVVDPGYLTYPTHLVQSVKSRPGSGSTFTVTVPTYSPPAPPLGQNSYYDAVNKALGATVDFQIVEGADYTTKTAAMLASGDMSDVVMMQVFAPVPRLGEAVQSRFADLGPYLSQRAVEEYPNLAALPTENWEVCVIGGQLSAIPLPYSPYGWGAQYRTDIFESMGLAPPTNANQLLELCKELTRPRENRWACLGSLWNTCRQMYGGPTTWMWGPGGKLVHLYETENFIEAAAFSQKLHAGGYALDLSTGQDPKVPFASGRVAIYEDGIDAWPANVAQQRPTNPSFKCSVFRPFGHDGGPCQGVYLGNDAGNWVFLNKKLPSQKIRELLRIANFCAAPFGTLEYQLVNFGAEGADFTRQGGVPILTTKGETEITVDPPYSYLAAPRHTLAYSGLIPNDASLIKDIHDWQTAEARVAKSSPERNVFVQVPPNLSSAATHVTDTLTDVQHGRKTINDLKSAVQTWRGQAGDQLRGIYEDAIAAQRK
jgi:putative aldouronate transport system substrate-binding protein